MVGKLVTRWGAKIRKGFIMQSAPIERIHHLSGQELTFGTRWILFRFDTFCT